MELDAVAHRERDNLGEVGTISATAAFGNLSHQILKFLLDELDLAGIIDGVRLIVKRLTIQPYRFRRLPIYAMSMRV